MAEIHTLNKNGTDVYPVTKADAVYMNNTNSVESEVSGISSDVSSISSELHNFKQNILDDLYFKPGDRFDIKENTTCSAHITSSSTTIRFNIVVDKSMRDVEIDSVTIGKASIRHVNGGYVLWSGADFTQYVSVKQKLSDRTITIILYKSPWTYSGTTPANNTPMNVNFESNVNYITFKAA